MGQINAGRGVQPPCHWEPRLCRVMGMGSQPEVLSVGVSVRRRSGGAVAGRRDGEEEGETAPACRLGGQNKQTK